MENSEPLSALRISPTVRALGAALRGKRENVPECSQGNGDRISPEPEKLWFKESTAKNLRTRDFLSPTTVLGTLFADGQVSGEPPVLEPESGYLPLLRSPFLLKVGGC